MTTVVASAFELAFLQAYPAYDVTQLPSLEASYLFQFHYFENHLLGLICKKQDDFSNDARII
jgi:hypothetical protein